MALYQVDTANPGGGYYPSLSAAISEIATNDNPMTEDHTIECEASTGVADTTGFTLDLDTTSSYTLTIKPASSDAHDGTWNASGYRLELGASSEVFFTSSFGDYVNYTFDGMQLRKTAQTDNNDSLINFDSTREGQVIFKGCLIRGASGSASRSNLINLYSHATDATEIVFVNNIIYDMQTISHVASAVFRLNVRNPPIRIYNNTVIGCSRTIYTAAGSGVDPGGPDEDKYTNCVFKNNILDPNDGLGTTFDLSDDCDYNRFSIADDFGGAHSAQSQTFTFVSAGTDYHLASGDTGARGHGDDLSADSLYDFTDDIDGDTRSAWDCGADEYNAGGGSANARLFLPLGQLGRLPYAPLGLGEEDVTAPAFASAAVATSGSYVDITVTEATSPPLLPASLMTGFSITASGGAASILTAYRVSPTTVRLMLDRGIQSGETVTASYTAGNVTDSAGTPNNLTDFTDEAVTNNSTFSPGSGARVIVSAGGSRFGVKEY